MFEHKILHMGAWYQNTFDERLIIMDFLVVASNLGPYVLETLVKSGEELSTDGELDQVAVTTTRQTWQIQTCCMCEVGTPGPVCKVFDSHQLGHIQSLQCGYDYFRLE